MNERNLCPSCGRWIATGQWNDITGWCYRCSREADRNREALLLSSRFRPGAETIREILLRLEGRAA